MIDDELSVTALECGRVTADRKHFIKDETGPERAPVYVFLIRHPKGLALFDAGLVPAHDGAELFGGAFSCDLPAGHDIASRLRALDIDPAAVPRVVLSHSHFDHAAGLALLPNAEVLIHGAELDSVLNDERRGHDRPHFEHGHVCRRTGDSLDLFGDGSVEVFATPGHTCGHQSLRVRRADRWDVLTGDACYFCRSLETGAAPQAYPWNLELYEASLERFRDMRRAGDFVVPGHDEGFLAQIPADSRIKAAP